MTSFDSLTSPPWYDAERAAGRKTMRRTLRKLAWSWGKLGALVLLVGAGLAAATALVSERPMPQPRPPMPADLWVEIRRPMPLFGLTGTDFAKLPLAYTALRHAAGGGRRDSLTFGDIRGDKGWLKLSLYRLGTEASPVGTEAQDVSDLTRGAGLDLSDIAAPTSLATRFGPFEAMDLRVGAGSGAMPCLGFRNGYAEGAVLRIAGLACGTATHPMGRDFLTCIIDRIDLVSAGDDEGLRNLFVAAERRRGSSCLPSPLTSAGGRPTWLDANSSAPILKALSNKAAKTW